MIFGVGFPGHLFTLACLQMSSRSMRPTNSLIVRREFSDHFAVRSFEEAEFVYPSKLARRPIKPDVWAFRRLNWANTPVVEL
jgi:hypothetical protein